MHCLELVCSKNYFNLTKIFVGRLFKLLANQTECSKFLVTDKCKQLGIYGRMSTEKNVLVKTVNKWTN